MGSITDKIGHGYDPDYRALAVRHPVGLLVEVGIADGAGLRYFRDIGLCDSWLGVDHNRHYVHNAIREGFDGYCNEQDSLDLKHRLEHHYCEEGRHFDTRITVIVDDASHDYEKTIATFNNLWPVLRPGGTYVIEDWSHLHEAERYEDWYYSGRYASGPNTIVSSIDRKGLIILHKAEA